MYELIILSLLMYGPLHGYLIAKITNDMIGPWAKVSNGTMYPLLTRLEREKLIQASSEGNEQQHGDRQLRSFMITDSGQKRFHQLMMDTTSNPGEYQKFFRFKVPHLALVKSAERLHLLDHYLNYCQTHILYTKSEAEDIVQETSAHKYYMSPIRLEATLDVIEQMANQWQAELEWTKQLREKEVARGITAEKSV